MLQLSNACATGANLLLFWKISEGYRTDINGLQALALLTGGETC